MKQFWKRLCESFKLKIQLWKEKIFGESKLVDVTWVIVVILFGILLILMISCFESNSALVFFD